MWCPGKCFLMLFGCPRQNINHSPDNLKVIYIRPFVFYARISHQFMTSELKNVEKLVEQTIQAFEPCELGLGNMYIHVQICDLHSW